MDSWAGVSIGVHMRFRVWDGAGGGKKRMVGGSPGLGMGSLSPNFPILARYSKECEYSKFKPGLPGCYEGKCQGRKQERILFNSLTFWFAVSKYFQI